MDAAIRASPAEWDFWFEPDDLARLGLLAPVPSLAPAPPNPGSLRERELSQDGPASTVPA
jgi:hypothetical protein